MHLSNRNLNRTLTIRWKRERNKCGTGVCVRVCAVIVLLASNTVLPNLIHIWNMIKCICARIAVQRVESINRAICLSIVNWNSTCHGKTQRNATQAAAVTLTINSCYKFHFKRWESNLTARSDEGRWKNGMRSGREWLAKIKWLHNLIIIAHSHSHVLDLVFVIINNLS